jgi:CRP-like cAMP-binding protein
MCFRVMKCQHFKKGQTIFHKGDRPRSFYIILTGEVYVVDTKDPEQLQRESDDRSIEIA